jgi:hypothetical protein
MPIKPMIGERRRLNMSATTPVTPEDEDAASIAVPINTSWRGERSSSETR